MKACMAGTLSVMIALAAPASALRAQAAAPEPTHAYVVSGYGTAGAMKIENATSSFFASVSPIFLFQFSDRVLFESELEFELEEGATKTGLEYANIRVLPTDYVTITAGKFLLPFGVFIQRLHPTWINRFTSSPPIYGHEAEIPGLEPLLPIAADIGVMANVVRPLGGIGRDLTLSAFVSNGPAAEGPMGGGMGEPCRTSCSGSRPKTTTVTKCSAAASAS